MFHKNESEKDQEEDKNSSQDKDASYSAPYSGGAYGASQSRSAIASKSAQAPAVQNYTPSSEQEAPQLVIGKGINFSGQIESCDSLIVQGTVEAALKGARSLEIAQSGTFYGSIEISEAVIAGRFEGDLSVDGLLKVLSTGAITGSISYKSLEVESGALIEGKICPITSQAAVQTKKPAKKSASKKAETAPRVQKAPANAQVKADEGNQLFAANVAGGK